MLFYYLFTIFLLLFEKFLWQTRSVLHTGLSTTLAPLCPAETTECISIICITLEVYFISGYKSKFSDHSVSIKCLSSLLSEMWSVALNRILRNIAKKQNFYYFWTPHSWETAGLSNKNFIPVDSKLNEGYNLKFLQWYPFTFFFTM